MPGSTLMYGSIFIAATVKPFDFKILPIEEVAMPFVVFRCSMFKMFLMNHPQKEVLCLPRGEEIVLVVELLQKEEGLSLQQVQVVMQVLVLIVILLKVVFLLVL